MSKWDVLTVSLININILASPVTKEVFDRESTLLEEYDVIVGGDGTNQMVTMKRLGNHVALSGKLGADYLEPAARQMLKDCGVDTKYVITAENKRTAICFVLVAGKGKHHFLVQRGACDSFVIEDIDKSMLEKTKILNIGSFYTFKELYGSSMAVLLKAAKDRGLLTSADCMADVYNLGAGAMDEAFQYLDFFLPNENEARYITGESTPAKMADVLQQRGVKNVVIKLGKEGCYLREESGEEAYIPIIDAPVVDSTGAGDNFIAGFLHGVLRGWTLVECCNFATAAAAIAIGVLGATGAVKSEKQVKDMLENAERK